MSVCNVIRPLSILISQIQQNRSQTILWVNTILHAPRTDQQRTTEGATRSKWCRQGTALSLFKIISIIHYPLGVFWFFFYFDSIINY